MFLGGIRVEFLRRLGVGVGVGLFYPTPEVQLNHLFRLHRIPKLVILTRAR